MDYDYRLHRIDVESDLLTDTYDIPVLNMDIYDGKVWIYRYGNGRIQVMDLETGQILQPDFITDGTRIECPYSIHVDTATRKVYITDAANYVTPGSIYCFTPDGRLEYRIPGIGINPNTIQFCDFNVTTTPIQVDRNRNRANSAKCLSICRHPASSLMNYPNTSQVMTHSPWQTNALTHC